MDETIDVLVEDIRKTTLKIDKAETWQGKFNQAKAQFDHHFGESSGKYAVLGLLCVAAMVFDFMVNSRTMASFGKLLATKTAVLATMLTILDGFLAIQASGLLDRRSEILKGRSSKLWLWVLWTIAGVKIILFLLFYQMQATLWVNGQIMPKVMLPALPIVAFTLVIYAIFHFAGAGLWYVYGNIWYTARRLFGPDLLKLRSDLRKYESELKSHCQNTGVSLEEVERQYSISVVKS